MMWCKDHSGPCVLSKFRLNIENSSGFFSGITKTFNFRQSVIILLKPSLCRAEGRLEKPKVSVLFGGHNLPSLVDIGLTYLSKFGGAPPPSPGTTGLLCII